MMSVPDENLREVGFHRERSCQLLTICQQDFLYVNFSL